MIWPEIITGLLGLAGAVGVLKKGQADMEKNLSDWRDEIKGSIDLIRTDNAQWRESFHADLTQMRDTSQRLDKSLAVNQTTVGRAIQETVLLRNELSTEIRRQGRELQQVQMWRAAANQQLKQLDPSWEA